ncbi:hypothetical protein F66182_644 [Fusarium sp. NRRL 66182]|nr:hypothetical protein F66182_644 [Fusarium sp. NRRL 66182]
MRFFVVAALLVGSFALAAPAQDKHDNGDMDDACCCCDISEPAIVCRTDIKAKECVCADVVCPANAPIRWPATPTPTPAAVRRGEEKKPTPAPAGPPCCCCNIGKGAIVCEVRAQGEDNSCMCPMVMCPPGAPTLTVYSDAMETGK